LDNFVINSLINEKAINIFELFQAGANPTIAGYNASIVNFYNATGSLARFENKKNILL
jgi:hypothetical protein